MVSEDGESAKESWIRHFPSSNFSLDFTQLSSQDKMSIELFTTPASTPLVTGLTVLYLLCTAISTFDTRIIQAKKAGFLHQDDAQIPEWTGLFGIIASLSILGIILLNWKFAIALIVVKFILKVLPILENIGAFLLTPLVGKEAAAKVNIIAQEQKKASKALQAMEAEWKNKTKEQ